MTEFVDVDVRPMLRSGQEPFQVIMAAMAGLEPGQGMRLLATVRPVPLLGVMARHGFAHETTELEGGDWEVRFTPVAREGADATAQDPGLDRRDPDSSTESWSSCADCCAQAAPEPWPEPLLRLDHRQLLPPQSMAQIRAAVEQLEPGQTLVVEFDREPAALGAELDRQGLPWRGASSSGGAGYEVIIRTGRS